MAILEIEQVGPLGTNAFLLGCRTQLKGVLIDPGLGSASLLADHVKEHRLTVEAVWLTHSHWDHIGDVAKVLAQFNVPLFVHPLDAENVKCPGSDGISFAPLQIPGVAKMKALKDCQTLQVGAMEVEVIHTPGHTPGGVCFYLKKEGLLFSGDTLFKGSIGLLSLPGAQPEKMWPTLKKLAGLPEEVVVYPGHGPPTTIGQESWISQVAEQKGFI